MYLKRGAMKHAFLPLGVVIFLVAVISFYSLPYTGNVVSIENKSLALEIESKEVAKNSVLEGILTLTFNDTVSAKENISVTMNGENNTYQLNELLEEQNYSFEYAELTLAPINGEATKKVTFTRANSSTYIAFEVPRYAEIKSLSFELSADAYKNDYPKAVTIDMGGEGAVDWWYLGAFTGYSSDKHTSDDLDTSAESNVYISDSRTYFCEIISLTKTKDMTVEAEYNKVSSSGDIAAVILSFPTGDPEKGWAGGGNTCDLPEESGSCTIQFPYPIEGEYLLCMYSMEEAIGDACTSDDDCPANNISDDDVCHENIYELPVD